MLPPVSDTVETDPPELIAAEELPPVSDAVVETDPPELVAAEELPPVPDEEFETEPPQATSTEAVAAENSLDMKVSPQISEGVTHLQGAAIRFHTSQLAS